ncbi:hypothetical protein C2S51_029530 [Perilla frutescens var. frutescens]|nr:hypothetical protein C2S51_029530 [Perilla frutescens var. frutescens]
MAKMFPKLNKVDLYHLPNLVSFCQGIEGIEFPLLTKMSVKVCPKMTSMVSSNENNSGGSNNADNIDDHHYSHLFCQPEKVSFGNLKELQIHRNPFSCGHKIHVSLFIRLEWLTINGYEGSMSLFSSSVAGNLVNLKELSIYNCDEMVKVINDDEEKAVSGGQRTLLFPKLEELHLYFLPELVSFCECKCDVELPSLRQVEIFGCLNMKYFTWGHLTTPKLEIIKINDDDFGGLKDLNDMLQLHFLAQEKKPQEEDMKGGAEEEQERKGDQIQIEDEHNS